MIDSDIEPDMPTTVLSLAGVGHPNIEIAVVGVKTSTESWQAGVLQPTESGSSWVNHKLAHRIPELDGLRGLALLLILVLHYFADLAMNDHPAKALWQILFFRFFRLLRLSWSGVDLFFVLSGFLIGGILLDAKKADGYYRTFYLRRVSRIVPLYALLIATFIVGTYWVPMAAKVPSWMFDYRIPLWSYPLFVQNVFMALHSSYGPFWMGVGVTWSLAVEEQFYLLLPFVIRRLSHRGIVGFAVGMIVVAPTLRMILERHAGSASDVANYALLPCRADALGFGLLIAIACRNQTAWTWLISHRRYVYLAYAILGFGIVFWTVTTVRLGYTWMAAFYACLLVLVIANPTPGERKLFGSFVLVRLGTVAYAVCILRLYHYICFGAPPTIYNWPTLGVTILSLATVFVLSAISWQILERPLIKRARLKYRYGQTLT
jgi:peptidoglycan/LPS O-acetylase OafA/YrhL